MGPRAGWEERGHRWFRLAGTGTGGGGGGGGGKGDGRGVEDWSGPTTPM